MHTSLASPDCCKVVCGVEDRSSIVSGLPGELLLTDGTGLEEKGCNMIQLAHCSRQT